MTVNRPQPPYAVCDDWFDAPVCRNCGAACDTPHCGQCGQKIARRLVWRDIWKETWERLRYFELKSAKTVRRLVLTPGKVARDYVLGRRTAHTNPLALLVATVATLVLVLAAGRYFEVNAGADDATAKMAQRVVAYANWSFSLGIVAIFAGSFVVFRTRLGYNWIEHAVLAIYCQSLILIVSIVNLLPTLVWRDPGFVATHKAAAQYYLPAIKLVIVAAGYAQFFRLTLRHDWARLALACLVYSIIGWALLRVYAAMILWLVR